MQNLQTKPRLNFDQATAAAQNGSCACEYIGALAHGIDLALTEIRREEEARLRNPHLSQQYCGPICNGDDWNALCSMLNLLREQARLSMDLFGQIEIATPDRSGNA